MNLYVASSWRNDEQPGVVEALRAANHEVYDFRNPPDQSGFSWSDVDPAWKDWTATWFRTALGHPLSEAGYAADKAGMDWADACVLLMPSGRSAHLEAGYMAGEGKPVCVLLLGDFEAELMYKLLGKVCLSLEEVVAWLETQRSPEEVEDAEDGAEKMSIRAVDPAKLHDSEPGLRVGDTVRLRSGGGLMVVTRVVPHAPKSKKRNPMKDGIECRWIRDNGRPSQEMYPAVCLHLDRRAKRKSWTAVRVNPDGEEQVVPVRSAEEEEK